MMKLLFLLLVGMSIKTFSLIPTPTNLLFNNHFEVDTIVDKNMLVHNNLVVPFIDKLTKIIPNIDLIGHNVILIDKNLIVNLINNDFIDNDIKKDIILTIIRLTQEGDQIGTFVLQNYYNLVNHIF